MCPLIIGALAPSVRTPLTSNEGVIDLNEVFEVMSPQVRVERMGPATVEDLPRYHSLVERIDEVANHWRSTGHLMGPCHGHGNFQDDFL